MKQGKLVRTRNVVGADEAINLLVTRPKEEMVGLMVEEVIQVMEISSGDIQRISNDNKDGIVGIIHLENMIINIIDMENMFKAHAIELATTSDDPDGAIAKEDLTQILQYAGVDESASRSIAEAEGLSTMSGVDVSNKSYNEALKTTAKNAKYVVT